MTRTQSITMLIAAFVAAWLWFNIWQCDADLREHTDPTETLELQKQNYEGRNNAR